MTTTIKTEGFMVPGVPSLSVPRLNRSFADGASTIPTDALLQPFMSQSFPNSFTFSPPNHFQAAMFNSFDERPEPPISLKSRRKTSLSERSTSRGKPTQRSQSMSGHHPRIDEDDVWGESWAAPSLVPGSFGSYAEETVMDSPMTPAHPLPDDHAKKQRRRESHNLVEKRRREHINAMIEELSGLLPPRYLQFPVMEDDEEEDEDDSPKKKKTKRSGSSIKRDMAQCKGKILEQSVRYINDLASTTAMQAAKIQHMEALLGMSNYQTPYYGQQLEIMRPSPEPEMPWHQPLDGGRRSSSLSTSESYDSGERGRARRRDSDDLRISMSGMELEMFPARREDEAGGMRW